jgi:hypothetical protein
MNCRWGDAEETLHVRFGGGDAVDLRVIVDECEKLTLPRGKAGSHEIALSRLPIVEDNLSYGCQ